MPAQEAWVKMNEKKECIIAYIKEHQNDMYRFAYSYVKNREDALDIIQESVVKAISHTDSLKDIACIKAWIFKIITNEAYQLFRSRKRYGEDTDIESIEQESCTDGMTEYVNRQTVLREIMSLDESLRMVIVLRYFESMQIKEIADISGLSANTVKARLYKALNILKRKLGEDCL